MNTFRIDLQKYFDQLPDEEKELFSQYFNDTVKEYAKEFDNTQESEELSQVWNYMSGNIELKTVNGYYSYKRDAKGDYTDIPEAYNLNQPISINSDNVELIKVKEVTTGRVIDVIQCER